VFGIDLVMAVALDDLGSALGGLLCSLGKTVKSHHKRLSFQQPNLTDFNPVIPMPDIRVNKGGSPSSSRGDLSGFVTT
jgi:hypothetical protein